MPAMTLHDQIARARDRLVRAGVSAREADLDARLLARHVLGWDTARLLTGLRDAPPPGFAAPFDAAVTRRERHEPIAYITGVREFWGLPFDVSADVLVPRPETELIVEEAVTALRESGVWASPGRPIIVDVGTGSGCLAVALARECPSARVVATDISAAALRVARRNALRFETAARTRFVRTHLLSGLGAAADLIVSNPPYVPTADAATLPPDVRTHEPPVALFAGPDGLSLIRELLDQAADHLRPGGWLIFEFGFGQADAVQELISARGRCTITRIRSDLQGIPRTAVVRRLDR